MNANIAIKSIALFMLNVSRNRFNVEGKITAKINSTHMLAHTKKSPLENSFLLRYIYVK